MKKSMLALCLVFAGLVAYAQDTTSTDQTQTQQQYPTTQMEQDDRERINSRDLPDAIKRSLETQEYRGWLINSAYKAKGLDAMGNQPVNQDDTAPAAEGDTTSVSRDNGAYAQEVFVVELKNGAQTKTVRFDKEGNKLDDQGTDNDQN